MPDRYIVIARMLDGRMVVVNNCSKDDTLIECENEQAAEACIASFDRLGGDDDGDRIRDFQIVKLVI
jgi:hypothetical protein